MTFLQKNSQKETTSASLKEAFFTNKEYTRGSWVNIGNIIFHELAGINVINLYSNTILNNILSDDAKFTPRQGSYVIGVVQAIASGFCLWTLKTFGKRPLLIWGHLGIAASHFMVAIFTIKEIDIGVLTMICVFICIY